MIWSVWVGWAIESKCLISNIGWNLAKILSLKLTNRPFLQDYDSKLTLPKDFWSAFIGFGWSIDKLLGSPSIPFVLLFFFLDSAFFFFLFRLVHKNLSATFIIQSNLLKNYLFFLNWNSLLKSYNYKLFSYQKIAKSIFSRIF